MARFNLRLTERVDVAADPVCNLALVASFTGLGLFHSALNLFPGGVTILAQLWQ